MFERWFEPFARAFGHKAQREWAPRYLQGLLGPGDRKSVEPIAARVAPGDNEQLHHFVATSKWDTAPLEHVLASKANSLVGGDDAFLIIDDTSLPKKGDRSVGVAHQYCGAMGKQANCQVMVSVTLAREEIPVPVALRLFLPQSWLSDPERCKRAYVPDDVAFRTKISIALDEIDRLQEQGVQFGAVLADAGYGMSKEFRRGLTERGYQWTVGIQPHECVYAEGIEVAPAVSRSKTGRPRIHGTPSERPIAASEFIEQLGSKAFRKVTWRRGTKGNLQGHFAAVRIVVADGAELRGGVHLPGTPAWLIAERRADEIRYYVSNLPASASLKQLVRHVKARWSCEQAHQQMKEELGLDHFEGRSWHGLHHHALLTMIAMAFLQYERSRQKKS